MYNYLNSQKLAGHNAARATFSLTKEAFNIRDAWTALKSIPGNIRASGLAAQHPAAALGKLPVHQLITPAPHPAAALGRLPLPPAAHPAEALGRIPARAQQAGGAAPQAPVAAKPPTRNRFGLGTGLAVGAGVTGLGALGYAVTRQPPPYNNTGGMTY
jgi:hypothetical protein